VSYTVLARKWRPLRFDQLVGQQHIVQALVNALAADRLHPASLFAGTRGVGKTTVARILAKALNCETGVVPEPCGLCSTCIAIDEGRFVDLLEVDAASRTRVDDTRELLDNVQYAPTRGRFKVYLIDEVHMLSNHSFNALLKTLEEPPPHVKFLLATTDPQKLPVTVLSRCLQFNLKRLSPAQIEGQLARICEAEQVPAEPAGLAAIARAADGSMRDALSLLDQGIAFGAGKIEAAAVNAMLGTIDRGYVLRMLTALAAGDGAALLAEIERLEVLAPDYSAVLDDVAAALQQLAVLQLVGGRRGDDDGDAAALAELAHTLSPEDVQLYYQIALQGRRDLPISRDPRVGFEMTLLRMLAFRPLTAGPERQEAAPAARSRHGSPAPERRGAPAATSASAAASATQAGGAAAASASSAPAFAPASAPAPAPAPASAASASAPAPAPRPAVPPRAEPSQDWSAVLATLDLRGPARQLADNCDLESTVGGAWQLVLPPDKTHLNTQQLRLRLEAALKEQFGQDLRLSLVEGAVSRPTPAERRRAGENHRMRAARESIENDPNVRAAQAAFDATLEADTIRPGN
jgi:DNA polymerase-3 subunit gamma/tau